ELARSHPESLNGLLLVASSHPREFSLANTGIRVLKVTGSRDRLADPEEIRHYAANLPPTTTFLEIKGGNHAQFGDYGFQLGDGRATISREEQQAAMLEAVLALLGEVSDDVGSR